jgi:hypothetical protein
VQLYHFVVPLERLGPTRWLARRKTPAVSQPWVRQGAVERELEAELPASQPMSDDPGAVDVADG